MAWVYLGSAHAYAAPFMSTLATREGRGNATIAAVVSAPLVTSQPAQYGESAKARTIYTVISLVCMLLLAAMLGMGEVLYQTSSLADSKQVLVPNICDSTTSHR